MKRIMLLFLLIVAVSRNSQAQNSSLDYYLALNPEKVEAVDSGIQAYDVTLKWHNLDAITGNQINSNGVKATYLVGLENDSVGWRNVRLSQLREIHQKNFEGAKLPAFDKFQYKVNASNFLADTFYSSIPAEQRDLAKWLVSDAIQMHGLALYVFDSLRYNEEFSPQLLHEYDIKFQDWVTFSSRYQSLIWSGISRHNNEICAIVKFKSLYNPLEIDNDRMQLKGRSLYYGEIWISLTDKQVEYASMVEDVVMKLTGPMFSGEQLLDLQREVVFSKVNKL